uniref:Uncharacterized protein n=2 Tax=viral metagenome TaxID=1070528 RepID=A0A6H2A5C5_9ZZZZ
MGKIDTMSGISCPCPVCGEGRAKYDNEICTFLTYYRAWQCDVCRTTFTAHELIEAMNSDEPGGKENADTYCN